MFIEHANLTVSDVGRSAAFYCELFGFRIRWEGTTRDGRPAAHVGDDRSYLALFQAASPGRHQFDYTTVGLNHVGFVIEDLDAARERLATLGIRPRMEADYDPGRRLYFLDPDGIEIELVQYATATASDA